MSTSRRTRSKGYRTRAWFAVLAAVTAFASVVIVGEPAFALTTGISGFQNEDEGGVVYWNTPHTNSFAENSVIVYWAGAADGGGVIVFGLRPALAAGGVYAVTPTMNDYDTDRIVRKTGVQWIGPGTFYLSTTLWGGGGCVTCSGYEWTGTLYYDLKYAS
jgi:hypothetical protein